MQNHIKYHLNYPILYRNRYHHYIKSFSIVFDLSSVFYIYLYRD